MRKQLEKNINERCNYSGVFSRFGSRGVKSTIRGRIKPSRIPTVLLLDVYDEKGNYVADHIWIEEATDFMKAKLMEGDTVSFSARIREYCKGYFGDSKKIERTISLNYELYFIQDLKVERSPENEKKIQKNRRIKNAAKKKNKERLEGSLL